MKARRLPGVRCSTLKTECRSLLCLMIMPGRSCVAGIDIGRKVSLYDCGMHEPAAKTQRKTGRPQFRHYRAKTFILHADCAGREPRIGISAISSAQSRL